MSFPASGPESVLAYLVTPAAGKRQELLQTLQSLRTEIRREPGCLQCHVCRYDDAGDRFLLLSEWESGPDLARHMASESFGVLSGASRLLAASSELLVRRGREPSPPSP
jgi:quinol monooxygenase YgiN